MSITELITIDIREDGWYVLDPRNLSAMSKDGERIVKYGPYPNVEKARQVRESLYSLIHGDYS